MSTGPQQKYPVPSYWSGANFYFLLSSVKGLISVAADSFKNMKATYSTGIYKAAQNVQTKTSSVILGNHLFLLHWTSPWKDTGSTHPLLCQGPHQHHVLSPRISCRLQLLMLLYLKLQSPGRLHAQAPAPAHARAVAPAGPTTRALTASLGPQATTKFVQEEGRAALEPGTLCYRQNEARMTNERSQHCRSFPAQCPHRFLCEMRAFAHLSV